MAESPTSVIKTFISTTRATFLIISLKEKENMYSLQIIIIKVNFRKANLMEKVL